MNVIVDGLSVQYSRSGEGKIIVFLHGWGDNQQTFNDLKKSLENQYELILLDLPGFGSSETPSKTFSLELYAEFVSKFIEKIDAKPVYALVGHSNGGAIALKALAKSLIKPEKLVLLASSGVRSTYKVRKKMLRLGAKTVKIPLLLLPKSTQSKLKKKAYQKIGSELFVAEDLQETFKKVVTEDLVGQISNISTDTLLVYGSLDKVTPVSYGHAFNAVLPKSRLEVIKNAGHFLHHDEPELVAKNIQDFLNDK